MEDSSSVGMNLSCTEIREVFIPDSIRTFLFKKSYRIRSQLQKYYVFLYCVYSLANTNNPVHGIRLTRKLAEE